MKYVIKNGLKFSHCSFGMMAELDLPKGCRKIEVEIIDKSNNECWKAVEIHRLLPHQLYYKNIKEYTNNFLYDIEITPIFESFSIMADSN